MTRPLRIAVLAALTAFMMSSTPTTSAPVRPPCEDARDCPVGDLCVKKKFSDKTGFCTGAKQAKKVRLSCETAKDCPEADDCKIRPGHKTGTCVAVKKPTSTPSQSY
jgi:hypothetical protein